MMSQKEDPFVVDNAFHYHWTLIGKVNLCVVSTAGSVHPHDIDFVAASA